MLFVQGSSENILFRHWSGHAFGVRNFGNTKSMRVIFSLESLKFFIDFKNSAKNWEKVLCFWDNCIWIGIVKLSLLRRGYFSSAANVLRTSPEIYNVKNKDIFDDKTLTWHWSINMIMMLWCRFQQCFGTFTMLLDKGLSETIPFRHWSDHVYGVRNFGNTKSMRIIFFFLNIENFL